MNTIEDEIERLALWISCTHCGETYWCKTSTGNKAPAIHRARLEPIQKAFALGYSEGEKDTRSHFEAIHGGVVDGGSAGDK